MPRYRPYSRDAIDVHQVVAYNFRRAREEKGWTQAETSDQLEPFLGYRLKQSGVSAIERTFEQKGGGRNLDVNELVAFASCFRKPLAWFLMPPVGETKTPVRALGPGESQPFRPAMFLFFAAIGALDDWDQLVERLREILEHGDTEERSYTLDAVEEVLGLDPENDVDLQIDLRRQALRDVRLGEFIGPRDEFVQQAASMFIELVRLASPDAFLKLKDMTRDEALTYLASAETLVSGLGRERKKGAIAAFDKHRSFDDARPLDLDSLYPENQ